MISSYTGILFFTIVVIGFTLMGLVLSHFIGHKTIVKDKLIPYECGVDPIGDARIQISIKFYLVAMLFIIFDVEALFLYTFALIFRELGILGLIEILIFIAILMVGFIYVWGKGGFEWE